MISSDVGVRFSSRNRHINWPADCQLGCLTTFYSFALRYFFHDLVQLTRKKLNWEEGQARFPPLSSCLVCVCPRKITAEQMSGKPCVCDRACA